jgi:hypothetical protein
MPTAKTKPKPPPEATGTVAHEVLTLAEAAAWLRVSEAGLKADADAGRVPGRVVAGEWRFSIVALTAWLGTAERASETSREGMLAAFGAWKDFGEDPERVIAELRRARKGIAVNKE